MSFKERSIERGVMRDDQISIGDEMTHDRPIDAMTLHHLVSDTGNGFHFFGKWGAWILKARIIIFGAQGFTGRGVEFDFNESDFDDLVFTAIEARRFGVEDEA